MLIPKLRLGDVISRLRRSLDLEPLEANEAPLLLERLKVPFTYCWSPAVVPDPADWPTHIGKFQKNFPQDISNIKNSIDVCGFFLSDASRYKPSQELDQFLQGGPPPIYVGFGSVVIDDPEKMIQNILEAIEITGVRAIISRGCSKLGGDRASDSTVFYVDDCPKEWLFQNVSVVVHDGEADATACGLANGRPTTVIPFFGE